MKNKEKLILYAISILIIIAVIFGIIYFVNNKNEKEEIFENDYIASTEQKLNLKSGALENHFYDSSNKKNISYNVSTLNDDLGYSVDYGCDYTNDSLTFREYVSDQGMAILINGYPNNTFESLGCMNEDEAYLATQMAFWEVMNRTGESIKSTEIFRVANVNSIDVTNDSYNRIMQASKKLVNLAETEPYSKVPTMNIKNGNVTSIVADESVIIGPYTVEISDDAELKTLKASLINAPASAKIIDINGNEKDLLSSGDTIYIRMNKDENESTFSIKFEASVNRKVGGFFEGNSQDFAKLYLIPVKLEKELTIEFSKTKTLGRIELIVVDKNNSPINGAVFSFIDSNNNVLLEIKSGKDGVIDFYSVPEGNYTIKQISTPENYELKENSKTVTVTAGELTTVKFEN